MTNDSPVLYGRRLDSPHSKTRDSTLVIRHLNHWPGPVDFEQEARKLLAYLAEKLPPGTMAALEWSKDLVRDIEALAQENARLRLLNESLAARLAGTTLETVR